MTTPVLQLGSWPGRAGTPGRSPGRARVEPIGARPALLLVAAAERGRLPERFGLAVALEVLGPSTLRGFLIVADDLDVAARRRLRAWARLQLVDTPAGPRPLELVTLRQFFDYRSGPFTTTCYAGMGAFIGADVGRTLGLVAESSALGRGFWLDGWRIWLPTWSEEIVGKAGRERRRGASPHRPPLHVRAASSHGLLARFDRPPRGYGKRLADRSAWPGRFVDVVPAGHALDGVDSSDLADHLEGFGLPRVEVPAAVPLDPDGAAQLLGVARAVHGLVLVEEVAASRWAGGTRGLDLAQLYSPASIGAELLRRARVTAPLVKFPVPADAALDRWQGASHGGWQTAELAGAGIFPAADIDVRSAYPAVWSLTGAWAVLRAAELVEQDATADMRELCAQVASGDVSPLLDRSTWRRLGLTLAEVVPDGDVLPVDVVDEAHPDGGVSWRSVRSDVPLPYAWPHVVLSTLLTGQVPEILMATRLSPVGSQLGLRRRLPLLDGLVVPTGEDPVPALLRRRQEAKDHPLPGDPLAAHLRGVLNALTYGTPGRLDPVPLREGRRIVGTVEVPAEFTFPPIAATVAGGTALLVGIAEHLVVGAGGTVASRDTDGLLLVSSPDGGPVILADGRTVGAISWHDLDAVRARFDRLDPFGDGRAFWSCDREHEGLPLWGLVLRRKRYAIFTRDSNGSLAEVVKATEHALAVVEPPPQRRGLRPDGRQLWTSDVAERVVREEIERSEGREPSRCPLSWADEDGTPALVRSTLGTPGAVAEAPAALGCRPFSRVVRPILDRTCSPGDVPPWHLDPGADLAGLQDSGGWRDDDGRPVVISTRADRSAGYVLDTIEGRSFHWARPKVYEPPGEILVRQTVIRRVGRAGPVIDAATAGVSDPGEQRVVYEDADLAALARDVALALGPTALAARAGIPLKTAKRLSAGVGTPSESTVRAVLLIEAEVRNCPGCGERVQAPRATYCSTPCRERSNKRKQRSGARGAAMPAATVPDSGAAVLRVAWQLAAALDLDPVRIAAGACGRAIRDALAVLDEAAVVSGVIASGPLTGAMNRYGVVVTRLRRLRAELDEREAMAAGLAADAATLRLDQAERFGAAMARTIIAGELRDVGEAEIDARYGAYPELHVAAFASFEETLARAPKEGRP